MKLLEGYHTKKVEKQNLVWKKFKSQIYLQLFALAGVIFLLIFSYIPMFGIIIAFKKYSLVSGISGIFTSKWVGFKYFSEFLSDPHFWVLFKNTMVMSIYKTVFTFPLPILFAILLNEIRNVYFKKFVQTVSYLPHFISWVVVSGILFVFLATDGGLINKLLMGIHLINTPISFLSKAQYFLGIVVISDAWKEFGWWAIIFIAAIAAIDQQIYEAAEIDGAGRFAKIWNITLPSIKGAISVVLILSIGNLLGGGISGSNFDQSFLLGNALNADTSEIIATYVLKTGLAQGQYSYATAIGILQSLISVVLIFGSNHLVKKLTGTGVV